MKKVSIPENLEKDAGICLAFLIANQKEWKPEVKLYQQKGMGYTKPITLIGVTDSGEVVAAHGPE